MSIDESLRVAIGSLVPSIALTTDLGSAGLDHDWSSAARCQDAIAVHPRTYAQVQDVVRFCAGNRVPVIPSGGRTGLSGGAVPTPGSVVVSLDRLTNLLEFNEAEGSFRVQAGVTTGRVQEAAMREGYFYPVDLASRGSSQIGGNIATNAGGINVLRYGMTRNWVAGLKVITGTGDLLDLNKGLVKNATGYDLRHLFIGSEGTLGIIVEATLQLTNSPPPQQVMVLALPSLQSIMEVFVRARRGLVLSAFEFFSDKALRHVLAAGGWRPFEIDAPYYILAEFDEDELGASRFFEDSVSSSLVIDGVLSKSGQQAAELWRLREGITESLSRYRPYKNDIAVRVGQVPAFLERIDGLFAQEYPGFEVIWFGHVGDGNLHISVLPPDGWSEEAFLATCERVTHRLGEVLAEFGGSISAEHGVGLLKRDYLHYSRSPAEIELMRQMKRVFDPAGIMNPGKLFAP